MENRINILFIKEDINIAIDIQQPDLSNLIHKIFYTIFVNITRIILFFPKLYANCCKHHTKIILFTALCISSRT